MRAIEREVECMIVADVALSIAFRDGAIERFIEVAELCENGLVDVRKSQHCRFGLKQKAAVQ